MVDRRLHPGRRLFRIAVLLAAGLMLPACSSVFSDLPGIGEPAGTPTRPDVSPEFPHVFRTKNSDEKPPPDDEAKKLEAELAQARTGAAEEKRRSIQQPAVVPRQAKPRENR